jgi:hypothetical protein
MHVSCILANTHRGFWVHLPHHHFACFMQLPHFALDLKPLEHYFNSSIIFQLEQPFNFLIKTIGTGMTHPMNPKTLFQWKTFKINSKT